MEESDALAFFVAGSASAWGREPGSLHSADSGRDDTKIRQRWKSRTRWLFSSREVPVHGGGSRGPSTPQTPVGMTQRSDEDGRVGRGGFLRRGKCECMRAEAGGPPLRRLRSG